MQLEPGDFDHETHSLRHFGDRHRQQSDGSRRMGGSRILRPWPGPILSAAASSSLSWWPGRRDRAAARFGNPVGCDPPTSRRRRAGTGGRRSTPDCRTRTGDGMVVLLPPSRGLLSVRSELPIRLGSGSRATQLTPTLQGEPFCLGDNPGSRTPVRPETVDLVQRFSK